jgi:hypothetical protein
MGNLTDKPELNEKKGKIGNLDSPKNPFDYMKREYGTVPLDTKRAPFQWVSEVAYKNVHRIVSRGYDTTEVMEEGYGVVDMLFIDYQARIPTVAEEQMLNYVMIMALEDGLSGPAVMSRIVAQSGICHSLEEWAQAREERKSSAADIPLWKRSKIPARRAGLRKLGNFKK